MEVNVEAVRVAKMGLGMVEAELGVAQREVHTEAVRVAKMGLGTVEAETEAAETEVASVAELAEVTVEV